MDFIELQIADDIQKLKDLVKLQAYEVKLIKIIYNPAIYSHKDIEEFQHLIEKYFPGVPVTFEESNSNKNIGCVLGIE